MSGPKVGLLIATSGQYEEYRAWSIAVYESCEEAKAEADRRNAFIPQAAEDYRETWDEPDEDWEATEGKQKRILNKLRRDTSDKEIESHDIGDLNYSVQELPWVTPVSVIRSQREQK